MSTTDTEMTDQALKEWADRCEQEVVERRREVADALRDVVVACERDELALRRGEPLFSSYDVPLERLTAVRDRLRESAMDLSAVNGACARRLATRDTASSASRQHYIDTGNYLNPGEAIES